MFKVERISARTGSVQCKRGLIPVGSTARVQVPAIASLDGEGSQDAGPIGTRIDSDPVLPLFDRLTDRVPMHHHTAMIRVVHEEGLTDPPKVGLKLLIDGNIRLDAGVDKQIIPEAALIDEAL